MGTIKIKEYLKRKTKHKNIHKIVDYEAGYPIIWEQPINGLGFLQGLGSLFFGDKRLRK